MLQVVQTYCGHGIGSLFHTVPNIPHYPKNKAKGIMKAGHIFTIEPMINAGTWRDRTWPDNWTAVTADGKRSAQVRSNCWRCCHVCASLSVATVDTGPHSSVDSHCNSECCDSKVHTSAVMFRACTPAFQFRRIFTALSVSLSASSAPSLFAVAASAV